MKNVDLSPFLEIIDDVAFNRCTDKFTTFQKDAHKQAFKIEGHQNLCFVILAYFIKCNSM